MNKQDLIATVARDAGLTKSSAAAAVESFLAGISKTLKKGGSVTLVGFGTFKVSVRKPRMGRNPQTGAAVKIPRRKVARFAPGKGLRDMLN